MTSPSESQLSSESLDRSDAVAVFSRDAASGELTFVQVLKDGVGGVDGLDWASSVTLSPDGHHVYVAGSLDNAVVVFSRNVVSGKLTFVEAIEALLIAGS